MSCSASTTGNASENTSVRAAVDQSIQYADLVVVYKYYIAFGLATVFTNIICVLVVLSKRHMREKYGSFGVLSFGGLLNALGMVLAGAIRINLIYGMMKNYSNIKIYELMPCLGYLKPCNHRFVTDDNG